MRSLLLITLLSIGSPAAGQDQSTPTSRIAIYSDATYANCHLSDDLPRLVDVFLVHENWVYDATALQFKLTASSGFTGVWVQDTAPAGMLAIGASPTGIDVSYQACLSGDIHFLRVTYQLLGTSSSCSFVQATPHPAVSSLYTSDCGLVIHAVDAAPLLVNPNHTCPCQEPLSTRATTWGQVKALYR